METFCIDDHISIGQKLVCYAGRSLQITSTIILQVEYQVGHAELFERIYSTHHLLMRLLAKVFEPDEPDTWTYHIGCINREDGYLRTLDYKREWLVDTPSDNRQRHLRATFASKSAHDVVPIHLHTSYRGVIDGNNTVASEDAHFLRRASRGGLHDHQCVVNDIELHTNTLEIALQWFVERLRLLGIGVTGMGIQLLQHATDSILHEFALIDRIDIIVVDSDLSHL